MKIVHEKIDSTSYECRLEIKDPDEKTAGMYKCVVSNEKGEINGNVMLNVQMAQSETITETKERKESRKVSATGVTVKKERRKSVILQCAVSGQKDVEISWKKGGQELETTEKKTSSRYSVEKKFSEANQTMIQLEIMEADVNDSGVYELVAKNAEGETQSQTVELTAAQVEMSLKAQEDAAESKAKKKKKKKKKVEKKRHNCSRDLIIP
jgi:membrane-bound lytic murein transglycosylase